MTEIPSWETCIDVAVQRLSKNASQLSAEAAQFEAQCAQAWIALAAEIRTKQEGDTTTLLLAALAKADLSRILEDKAVK